ncbi:YbaB/EbfC family nucleoid-associated protein [Acholeplasma sp. OttesenSCG-928-E16]|nr:YbaB/EbfC family nucleoid-associated protein [Acholeplasma sp. OttesenSCG-928-E16]
MNPNMMKKLKKMQEEMAAAQEKLEMTEFIGKATGVTVVAQGTRQLVDIKISEELMEEPEIMQDAIIAAVNDALAQIDKAQQDSMGKFTNGIGGFGF